MSSWTICLSSGGSSEEWIVVAISKFETLEDTSTGFERPEVIIKT